MNEKKGSTEDICKILFALIIPFSLKYYNTGESTFGRERKE